MNAQMVMNRTERSTWVVVLGAFTLWLVVQNAVLMVIVSVLHPGLVVRLAVDAVQMFVHAAAAGGHAVAALSSAVPGSLFGVTRALTGGLL